MSDEITVFMEYKIKPEYVQEYQTLIKAIKIKLQTMGATDFHSYKAADQDLLFVEYFKAANHSMYRTIKEARLSAEEPVFKELHEMAEGGIQKIHCWAFLKQNLGDED